MPMTGSHSVRLILKGQWITLNVRSSWLLVTFRQKLVRSRLTSSTRFGFFLFKKLPFLETIAISWLNPSFLHQNCFRSLPTDLIKEIFVWLPIDDFSPVPTVCQDWKDLACSDEVWQTFYRYKFLRHNPDTMPVEKVGYLQAFRNRLADPQLGDKVEVAWRGKFRLEALDVYQGLAWWVAEIVDKHTSQGKYKIRYPGWESR